MAHRLSAAAALLLSASIALCQETAHPLQPPDRSSPRATLTTFLASGDAVGAFMAREYLPSPTRTAFNRLLSLIQSATQCLDLSEVAPADRDEVGAAAAMALYETLSRVQLPPFDTIPADQQELLSTPDSEHWVIPQTEIVLVRAESGTRSGQFLFSADSVARAHAFYEQVKGLPYTRPVPLERLHEIRLLGGGWLVPFSWIREMPAWLRAPVGGGSGWKWIALAVVLAFAVVTLLLAYRWSSRGDREHPFLQALERLVPPALLLAAAPAVAYLALVQINLIEGAGSAVELVTTAVMYLAGAWMSWRAAPVVAEAIIASPRIPPESIDAHLIRICTRLLGIVAGAGLLSVGAGRLGIPLYGIIAGLGVGGLAIALAAQPTIENLIGSLSLFADKPIRVGDFCKYDGDVGTVEAIGIRSTRIRGIDRTLTTIPNATFSKMPIVNFTRRDRMLIHSVIGVRYETTPEQLRYILVKLREMLLGHPRIDPDPARARFVGLGPSSLDIEVFAYAATSDWAEFLGIQEDVLLRIVDIVEQSGTAFAFPSQTLYLARDRGPDAAKGHSAEDQVRAWREEGRLPFPDFSLEQRGHLRGSLVYPPPGSVEAASAGPNPGTRGREATRPPRGAGEGRKR